MSTKRTTMQRKRRNRAPIARPDTRIDTPADAAGTVAWLDDEQMRAIMRKPVVQPVVEEHDEEPHGLLAMVSGLLGRLAHGEA